MSSLPRSPGSAAAGGAAVTDDLARMRARRAAAAKTADRVRRGVAQLRLNSDLDLELDQPGLDAILVWSPELAIELAQQMIRLARIARDAKKGPKR